jgi:hypothetical protein
MDHRTLIWDYMVSNVMRGELENIKSWFEIERWNNEACDALLRRAVLANQVEIVHFLLLQGANIKQANQGGLTLFHAAVVLGYLNMAKTLLKQLPALLDQEAHYGLKAIHFAAINDDREMYDWLVQESENLQLKNQYGTRTTGITSQCIVNGTNILPYISIIKTNCDKAKMKVSIFKQTVTSHRDPVDDMLFSVMKQLPKATPEDKQVLLDRVLTFQYTGTNPAEQLKITKALISLLLNLGTKVDDKTFAIVIKHSLPVLDQLLSAASNLTRQINCPIQELEGYNCLDYAVMNLKNMVDEFPQSGLFFYSFFYKIRRYDWNAELIAQLLYYGATFDKISFPKDYIPQATSQMICAEYNKLQSRMK